MDVPPSPKIGRGGPVPPLLLGGVRGGPELGNWLILADNGGMGQQLANELEKRGARCVVVYAGADYEKLNENEYVINPAEPKHFERLLSSGEPRFGTQWTLTKQPACRTLTAPSLDH